MTGSLIRPRPRRRGWLILTCGVAVVWSLVATLSAAGSVPEDAGDMRSAYMVGKVLGAIGLVGVVMTGVHYLLFLRRSAGELIGRHSLIIFFSALAGALPAMALGTLLATSGADEARLRAIDAEHTERVETETRTYVAQSEVLLGGKVLAAETLTRQSGIDQARANIAAYRELMAAHDALYRDLVDQTRGEIETSSVSAFTKGRGLEGFDRNTGRILAEAETIRLLENEILNSWEAVLDFLALRPRRWEARNGQFSFYTDADLAFFKGHMDRIDTLAAQIDARSAALRARSGPVPDAR